VSDPEQQEIPSTWFQWHASLIDPGMRVLDIACGSGRHAVAAARRGAQVIGIDTDAAQLEQADRSAKKAHVTVDWQQLDLERDPLPTGSFDMVMVFNYLDRARLPAFLEAVRPGGYFLAETFSEQQRELGWGPTSEAHLLKPCELWSLVEPFEIVLGREVLEMLDGRPMAVGSVLAQRPSA
jgi:2-polyprenyl-3-methyl-5-hydroxy-6-metoxy-1,4-benzoquinol methylase